MKIEKYCAFDAKGSLRYVGIGKPGRHRHVNSGKSHSHILNACVAVAGPFTIQLEYENGTDALSIAKSWEIDMIKQHGRLHLGTGTLLNRSVGGEETSTCADRNWYSSPDGKLSRRFIDETTVPSGWVRGRINLKGKTGWHGKAGQKPPVRKNWKAWHDPKTGEIRQVAEGEKVPPGFFPGTGLNSIGKKKWYVNILTGECGRFEPDKVPSGFIKGRK